MERILVELRLEPNKSPSDLSIRGGLKSGAAGIRFYNVDSKVPLYLLFLVPTNSPLFISSQILTKYIMAMQTL